VYRKKTRGLNQWNPKKKKKRKKEKKKKEKGDFFFAPRLWYTKVPDAHQAR
jgi:hypothetical protein